MVHFAAFAAGRVTNKQGVASWRIKCGRWHALLPTVADAFRLAARKQILEIIDRRRAVERDTGIGASIERQILARELAELDQDCESFLAVPQLRSPRSIRR